MTGLQAVILRSSCGGGGGGGGGAGKNCKRADGTENRARRDGEGP